MASAVAVREVRRHETPHRLGYRDPFDVFEERPASVIKAAAETRTRLLARLDEVELVLAAETTRSDRDAPDLVVESAGSFRLILEAKSWRGPVQLRHQLLYRQLASYGHATGAGRAVSYWLPASAAPIGTQPRLVRDWLRHAHRLQLRAAVAPVPPQRSESVGADARDLLRLQVSRAAEVLGASREDIAKAAGIGRSTLFAWMEGSNSPRPTSRHDLDRLLSLTEGAVRALGVERARAWFAAGAPARSQAVLAGSPDSVIEELAALLTPPGEALRERSWDDDADPDWDEDD
jgi:hypothetical protein